MEKAMDEFHAHKSVFIDLKTRKHFNIPKLHSMLHYVQSIRLLGSADAYDTEAPERLHIDYAKKAYRASNKRDYHQQMTTWLQRQEAIHRFSAYLQWCKLESARTDTRRQPSPTADALQHVAPYPRPPPCPPATSAGDITSRQNPSSVIQRRTRVHGPYSEYEMARHAAFPHRTPAQLMSDFGAFNFIAALTAYLKTTSGGAHNAPKLKLGDRFDVFKGFDIYVPGHPFVGDGKGKDSIRAAPAALHRSGRSTRPAEASTVLAVHGETNEHTQGTALSGLRVARVRVIFSLPPHLRAPGTASKLAYVEWFTPFRAPDPVHGMRSVSRSTRGYRPHVTVIPIENIVRSCHLLPAFGRSVKRSWRKRSPLDDPSCKTFYLNPWLDLRTFINLNVL